MNVNHLDIQDICRGGDESFTTISFEERSTYSNVPWITAGRASVHAPSGCNPYGYIRCELDFISPHQEALAFELPVLAVKFEFIRNGVMCLSGVVHSPKPLPSEENLFSVPKSRDELVKILHDLKEGRNKLALVYPQFHADLYEEVEGTRITAMFGPVTKESKCSY